MINEVWERQWFGRRFDEEGQDKENYDENDETWKTVSKALVMIKWRLKKTTIKKESNYDDGQDDKNVETWKTASKALVMFKWWSVKIPEGND